MSISFTFTGEILCFGDQCSRAGHWAYFGTSKYVWGVFHLRL